MGWRSTEDVGEDDLGGDLAGELILDNAYFFGSLVHEGDLAVADDDALRALILERLEADVGLSAGLARYDGSQLAVVVHGDLTVGGSLFVGNVSDFTYCLAVHGALRCAGLDIDEYSHVAVTGDLDTPAVRIHGSDGAMLHCTGNANVRVFIHDQDQYPIAFVAPPVEMKTYDDRLKALKPDGYVRPQMRHIVEAMSRGELG